MDYTVHEFLQARILNLSLLQGIFPTQGLNPGLPLCRWIFYQLSHKRCPKKNKSSSNYEKKKKKESGITRFTASEKQSNFSMGFIS